ncbi:MAG: dual specificity protein phosphatase family protein [Thaumarchaeota archaeon]|nr:dual specificity protein phosphatase family protein [Nitrososphaerota archaeon]
MPRKELIPWEPKRQAIRYINTHRSKPQNFRWIEKWVLATSGAPVSQKQLNWLVRKQRIGAILTLTEDSLAVKGLDLLELRSYLHVPMADHERPTKNDIRVAVSFINENYRRTPVLIHCLGGVGRTGVVLACFIAEKHGLDSSTAISYIRKIYPEYIEFDQEDSVHTFSFDS